MATQSVNAVVLLGAAVLLVSPAQAAMRYCSPPLISSAGQGRTELEAKKLALDDWFAKAKAQGFKDSLWRTAADKSLICKALEGGKFECTAAGRACTILQVPPRAAPAAPKTDGNVPAGDLGI